MKLADFNDLCHLEHANGAFVSTRDGDRWTLSQVLVS